jgi:hypothetical protein
MTVVLETSNVWLWQMGQEWQSWQFRFDRTRQHSQIFQNIYDIQSIVHTCEV